jgi:hypothetical protein
MAYVFQNQIIPQMPPATPNPVAHTQVALKAIGSSQGYTMNRTQVFAKQSPVRECNLAGAGGIVPRLLVMMRFIITPRLFNMSPVEKECFRNFVETAT